MNRYDLSIDDWAMNDSGVIGQVYALKRNTISLVMNGKESDHHLCQVLPIPLSDYIITKNGFEQKNNLTYVSGQVEIIKHRDNWNVVINKYCVFVDMNIKFVHELQRLLRLCGIEKSIEL